MHRNSKGPDNTAIIQRRASQAQQPTSGEPASAARSHDSPNTAGAQVNYARKLWTGQVALPLTFWLWGIALNFLLKLLFTFVLQPSALILLLYWGYYVFIVVAIWRSSERHQGPKVWGILARVSVILGLIWSALPFVLRA